MDFAIKEKETGIIIFCSNSYHEMIMYWTYHLSDEEKAKCYQVKILY